MNFKRAFLTALAVLMMPALAMAQTSSSTFTTSWIFDPAGPAISLDLTLTCNGGTPLTQTVSAMQGEVFNFTVVGAEEAQAVCNITLQSPPDFWTASSAGDCTDIPGTGTTTACVFSVAPDPFVFEADVSWTANSDQGSDVPVSGDLMLECTRVWDGSMVTTVSDDYMITAAGTYQLVDGIYAPHPDGSTSCMAELMVSDSAVDVDDSACSSVSVTTASPRVVSCDIAATVFFEGIPTLSQYGMAVMVLLMLGVGFVGFRRFV